MKRSVLLLAALFAVFSVQADNRPQAVLKQLTAALGALEGYSVVFEVHTDGDVVPGYYEVSGDNYYMHVNGQEVYGDAEFRYEIDPDRKEVVIDRVDLTSHNLLNNPTRAFDFIDGEYAASLLSEKGSTAVIRLTPLRIQSAVGQIDVEVDTARSLDGSDLRNRRRPGSDRHPFRHRSRGVAPHFRCGELRRVRVDRFPVVYFSRSCWRS